ncbi:MAG: hypothetical protein DRI34_13645 [Deltaproteobacteria bacterium]|nr:MAG: hypothetical protein DRI34_13645 [Deltaproteobacteria bacterium]
MEEFIRGPLVWIAFAVFFAGLLLQGWLFFRNTSPRQRRRLAVPEPKKKKPQKDKKTPLTPAALYAWLVNGSSACYQRHWPRLRRTVLFTHPFMTVVTVVFHTFLFAAPLLARAHNELLRRGLGAGLPSLADAAVDAMTLVVLLCGAIFLWRRLLVRRVRAITTFYDYLVLAITLAPFVTGFMAAHHWLDYHTVILVHIGCGELMLMAIPFTKLGHMIYFFLYRFLLPGEYSFGQGSRAW